MPAIRPLARLRRWVTWTSAGWLTLAWFGAAHLAEPRREGEAPRFLPGPWTAVAGAFVLVVFLLAGVQYATHVVDIDGIAKRFDRRAGKEAKDPADPVQSLGSRDPSLEAVGGPELAEGLERIHADRVRRGAVGPDPFLLTRHWFIAGKVHFHTAGKLGMEVRCWGSLRNVRATVFMQDWEVTPGRDAYYILSSARCKDRYRPEQAYAGYFSSFEPPEIIEVKRAGRVVMRWFVFPCRGVVKPYPNPLAGEE